MDNAGLILLILLSTGGTVGLLRFIDWRWGRPAQDATVQGQAQLRAELWTQLQAARERIATLESELETCRDLRYREREDLTNQLLAAQARLPGGRGTALLVHGLSLAGALSPPDQIRLVELLVAAPWLWGTRADRDRLLVGTPPAFQQALTRADGARSDLALIVTAAAAWGAPPGTPPLLSVICDNAAALLNGSTQGQALRTWRARVGLLPPEPPADPAQGDANG